MIAQDQATSVVWGMPGAVHQSGLSDATLALDDIGVAIAQRADRQCLSLRKRIEMTSITATQFDHLRAWC